MSGLNEPTPSPGIPNTVRARLGYLGRTHGAAFDQHRLSGRCSDMPGFKGNKQALPSKPCVACGRPMAWRKAWAKNWARVRYCSEACRRKKHG